MLAASLSTAGRSPGVLPCQPLRARLPPSSDLGRSQRPFSAATVRANGRGRTAVPSDPEGRALELTQRAEEDVRVHNHALPSAWLTGHGLHRAGRTSCAGRHLHLHQPSRAPVRSRQAAPSTDPSPNRAHLARSRALRPIPRRLRSPAGHRPRPDPARARPCVRACGSRPKTSQEVNENKKSRHAARTLTSSRNASHRPRSLPGLPLHTRPPCVRAC